MGKDTEYQAGLKGLNVLRLFAMVVHSTACKVHTREL